MKMLMHTCIRIICLSFCMILQLQAASIDTTIPGSFYQLSLNYDAQVTLAGGEYLRGDMKLRAGLTLSGDAELRGISEPIDGDIYLNGHTLTITNDVYLGENSIIHGDGTINMTGSSTFHLMHDLTLKDGVIYVPVLGRTSFDGHGHQFFVDDNCRFHPYAESTNIFTNITLANFQATASWSDSDTRYRFYGANFILKDAILMMSKGAFVGYANMNCYGIVKILGKPGYKFTIQRSYFNIQEHSQCIFDPNCYIETPFEGTSSSYHTTFNFASDTSILYWDNCTIELNSTDDQWQTVGNDITFLYGTIIINGLVTLKTSLGIGYHISFGNSTLGNVPNVTFMANSHLRLGSAIDLKIYK